MEQRFTKGPVEVLCDRTGRLGTLSYLLDEGMSVAVGDAVRVPFGTQERYGVIVGAGDPQRATRTIFEVYGSRSTPDAVASARRVAHEQYTPFEKVAARLGPTSGRGASGVDAGPVEVNDRFAPPAHLESGSEHRRRLLVTAPGVAQAAVAVHEAARLSQAGQVLILCATNHDVTAVLSGFTSGARRITGPAKSVAGSWKGFIEGTVRIGVASRAGALWAAPDLCAVVVVDESHPGHVERSQPSTHAGDIAGIRAGIEGLAVSYVATVPTPAVLGRGVHLTQVGDASDWPTVTRINRDTLSGSKFIPTAVNQAVAGARRQGRSVWVVTPSRAQRTVCGNCREPSVQDQACRRCQSSETVGVGIDPQRVQQMFGPVNAIAAGEVANTKSDPGSTVVVFDVSAALSAPDLYPGLWAARVVFGAMRLAGAGGHVIVVGSGEDWGPVGPLVTSGDLRKVAVALWENAREAGMPPFGVMVRLSVGQQRPPAKPKLSGVSVFGPKRVGDNWEMLLVGPTSADAVLGAYVSNVISKGRTRAAITR